MSAIKKKEDKLPIETDEYVVPIFKPQPIILSKDLSRRKEEETLRRIYRAKKNKTGEIL